MAGLSIADLLQRAGLSGDTPFTFDKVTGNSINDFDRKEFGDLGTEYYKTGDLGREYFMPVTVTFPDINKIVSGFVTGNVNVNQAWDLPYPMISISPSKTIVSTPLTERGGSAHEVICINDYEISVRGYLINKTDEYPEALVKQMAQVFKVNTPMALRCAATDMWLIDNQFKVILKSIRFPDKEGVKNVVEYEMQFVSDSVFDLEEI